MGFSHLSVQGDTLSLASSYPVDYVSDKQSVTIKTLTSTR
jgi:hypothetical protein